MANLDCRHLPEEGDSVALDAYIEELLYELEADEGFEFIVKELDFDEDEALAEINSLLGERQSEVVSNSTAAVNPFPGDEVTKRLTKTLLDARGKPDGISREGKCVTSEVDAACATKQKDPKGGDTTDDDVDVGPVCSGYIQSSDPTHRKHGRRKAEQQEVWLFGPSWVPHRKHGRPKTERQQRKLRGRCRLTHQKHGRWKVNPIEVQPPQLQL